MTIQSLWRILTEPVSLGFLVALLLLLALNLATARRQIDADVMRFTGMLFAAWTVTKLVAWVYGWPMARALYPITDLLQGLTVLYLCVNRPTRWKTVLLMAFSSKLLMHSEFHGARDSADPALYPYRIWLDVIFAVEILAVASSGGRIVGDWIATWVSGDIRRGGLVLPRTGGDHP